MVEIHLAPGGREVKVQGTYLNGAVTLHAPALPDAVQDDNAMLVSHTVAQLKDSLTYAFLHSPITCPSRMGKPLRTPPDFVPERFLVVAIIVRTCIFEARNVNAGVLRISVCLREFSFYPGGQDRIKLVLKKSVQLIRQPLSPDVI